MANPHGLPLSDVIKEEKRLGIVPKKGQSIQKRRRTITLKKSRLKGGKARDAKFRKTHRLRIRARDRERVRTPEQLRHQAEYQRQRRLDIKAARLLPPSKRTKKQKKLVSSWEKEMRKLSTQRELTKQERADREAWRKTLTPEQRAKEARRSAKNILGAAKRRSRRKYTTEVTGRGGRKRKVKKIAYAMSLDPDDLKSMEDSLYRNQLRWFNKGGVLKDWDHIVALKATDKFGNRIASGLTNPSNMRFMDPRANRIKGTLLNSRLLKSVENAMMKGARARGLMNPMAWPSMFAGFGLIAASPEDSMASMVGEVLIAAGDPLTTVLSGPSMARNPNYMGLLSEQERRMVDPTWEVDTAINTPQRKKRENIWT